MKKELLAAAKKLLPNVTSFRELEEVEALIEERRKDMNKKEFAPGDTVALSDAANALTRKHLGEGQIMIEDVTRDGMIIVSSNGMQVSLSPDRVVLVKKKEENANNSKHKNNNK